MLTLVNDLAYATSSAASATVIITDTPISAWRAANFSAAELGNAAISGDLADPDGDGLVNLVEYALRLQPRAVDTGGLPSVARESDGRLSLTYTRNLGATDVQVNVEVSTDLVTWNSGPDYTAVVQTIDGSGVQTVKVVSLVPVASSPQQFLRVKVTR